MRSATCDEVDGGRRSSNCRSLARKSLSEIENALRAEWVRACGRHVEPNDVVGTVQRLLDRVLSADVQEQDALAELQGYNLSAVVGGFDTERRRADLGSPLEDRRSAWWHAVRNCLLGEVQEVHYNVLLYAVQSTGVSHELFLKAPYWDLVWSHMLRPVESLGFRIVDAPEWWCSKYDKEVFATCDEVAGEFAIGMKRLMERCRSKGYVTLAEWNAAMPDDCTRPEAIEAAIEYIEDRGLDIYEA